MQCENDLIFLSGLFVIFQEQYGNEDILRGAASVLYSESGKKQTNKQTTNEWLYK